uniref:TLC domain-containing protein n=1 Tax=Timema poppense TaxID=170557 RepID=A0A7R9D4E7_TIMPO|nr:unnamed protein product [Timema poppensis]
MLEWFSQQRAQNMLINGPMMQRKADEFALRLGIENLKCSNGWLERFKVRHRYPASRSLMKVHRSTQHRIRVRRMPEACYFVYDLMDMMINHRKRSSYELMVHHVVVIICFGLSVMTRYYLGYGLMALLVEVNSIFLHIRQLMLIQSLRKSHILYRLNSLLTIGTFIVFRITTLGWMTRWLVLHRDELTVTAFAIGSASMPVIMVMNIVLFLRILNSDYRQRKPTNNDGFLNTLHQEEPLCNQDKTD